MITKSPTTLDVKTYDTNITAVLCLGEGTLTIDLHKEDTISELVSMFSIGFPADPLFSPNFGITPAIISSRRDINNTLGGLGIVLIFSSVHSDRRPPDEYTLSLELVNEI